MLGFGWGMIWGALLLFGRGRVEGRLGRGLLGGLLRGGRFGGLGLFEDLLVLFCELLCRMVWCG